MSRLGRESVDIAWCMKEDYKWLFRGSEIGRDIFKQLEKDARLLAEFDEEVKKYEALRKKILAMT